MFSILVEILTDIVYILGLHLVWVKYSGRITDSDSTTKLYRKLVSRIHLYNCSYIWSYFQFIFKSFIASVFTDFEIQLVCSIEMCSPTFFKCYIVGGKKMNLMFKVHVRYVHMYKY